MARELVLSLDGHEFPVLLSKVDREKLYGTTEIEAFDEEGNPASLKILAADGKTLIDRGGTALTTINEDGNSTERKALKPVDSEGEEIEPVPSSFNKPNVLLTATPDEYLSHLVKSVYLLKETEESDLDFLQSHLGADKLYKFPFSYRGGVEYDSAFVLGRDDNAFMVVGTQATVNFVKLSQAVQLDPAEEEEISADDIEFDVL